MKKRWLWVVLFVVLLAAGGGYLYYRFYMSPTQVEEGPVLQTTQVTLGDVVISADGTGNLLPSVEVDVGFENSGLLKTLEVQVGDQVTAGQILATIDTHDLEVALETARLQLEQAQINVDKLNVGPDDTEVTTAQINVAEARDNLSEQQVSLAAATERARLSWVTSANNLRDAQAEYSDIYWTNRNLEQKIGAENVPSSNYENEAAAKRAVENAEAAMEQARLSYESTQKQGETSLQTARYQVTTAQTNLDALYASASATDLASAQNSLAQAQLSYQEAQDNLEKAVLRSPISGTVMSVSAVVGTQVGTSAVITIADMDAPLLEFWVEETDMAAAQVGNKVNVVFDALPDLTFTGTVVQVDPALVTVGNTPAVQSWARLELAAHSERLLSGMAAQVEVIQAEARNVLLVPLEALRTLSEGQYAVFVVGATGELELRPVEVGLQDLVNAEIRSGLQVGDTVSLGETTSTTSSSSNTDTGTQTYPGGNFVPGMGPMFDGGGPP
jgi:HlyD family secretion protein